MRVIQACRFQALPVLKESLPRLEASELLPVEALPPKPSLLGVGVQKLWAVPPFCLELIKPYARSPHEPFQSNCGDGRKFRTLKFLANKLLNVYSTTHLWSQYEESYSSVRSKARIVVSMKKSTRGTGMLRERPLQWEQFFERFTGGRQHYPEYPFWRA